jgi:hypothetical protein
VNRAIDVKKTPLLGLNYNDDLPDAEILLILNTFWYGET